MLMLEIGAHQNLEELIPVDMPDEIAGIVVRRDIGRILGQDIPDDLIDRIITLLYQCIINDRQRPLEFNFAFFVHGKGHCLVEHASLPLTE